MSEAVKRAVEGTKTRVLDYLKNPVQGQTFGHLMIVLGFSPARSDYRIDGVTQSRILDRALQSLRKSGAIRYDGRRWSLVR